MLRMKNLDTTHMSHRPVSGMSRTPDKHHEITCDLWHLDTVDDSVTLWPSDFDNTSTDLCLESGSLTARDVSTKGQTDTCLHVPSKKSC